MTLDLRFREWAKRDNHDPFPPGIFYRLADQLLTDFSATQHGRNICVVDDDQLLTRTTVCHFGFVPINNDPVASLRHAILPFNLLAQFISSVINPVLTWRPDPSLDDTLFEADQQILLGQRDVLVPVINREIETPLAPVLGTPFGLGLFDTLLGRGHEVPPNVARS